MRVFRRRKYQRVAPRPPVLRALGRDEPPFEIQIAGIRLQRQEIFKHDSWAATALYSAPGRQVVCKFNRQQPIGLMPMRWLGWLLARREAAMLRRLADLPLVPRLEGPVCAGGRVLAHAVAHNFVAGHPLGRQERVSDRFFPELERLLAELHRRHMAYVDLHKRENILVGDDGRPYLIDFQISIGLPQRWPVVRAALGWVLRLLQGCDEYHLLKHFLASRPDQCPVARADLAARRPWSISLHRLLGRPVRFLRRKLLVLVGVRARGGRAETECFPELALRGELLSQGT